MKMKNKLLVSALLLGGLLSPQTFAADTVCSIVYGVGDSVVIDASNGPTIGQEGGIPLPDGTIAVASNFYDPAIELAGLFLDSATNEDENGDNIYTAIGVCHNATGHLADEIKGNNPAVIGGEWLSAAINYKYSTLLAADANTPYALFASLNPVYTREYVKLYASGIPALLAKPSSSLVAENLVTTTGTIPSSAPIGFVGGDVNDPIGPAIMNTANLQQVSVADRVNAPYGAAAASIIGAMGQYSTPITSGCTATTINTPDLYEYANIALTFDAIVSNACIDAGWVSWAQIKSAGVSTAKYITFPSFAIAQTGVRLTGAIPSASAAAAADALWNFANFTSPNAANGALGGSWNDWLEAHGYGAIPSQTNP